MDSPRVALIGLLVLAAVVYAPLRSAPMVYEDAHYLGGNGAAPLVWHSLSGRAATWASFRVTPDPASAHVGNIALHLVNGALVAGLGGSLAGPWAGAFAAGVFLLHPLQVEAVAYITARADLLVTLFTLIALWSALVWTAAGGVWRLALCAVALAAAAGSKEIGLVALPLTLLTVAVWRPGTLATRLLTSALCVVGAVVATLSAGRIAAWIETPAHLGGTAYAWPVYARLQAAQLAELLTLAVWPIGLSLDHDPYAVPLALQVASVALVLGLVALVVWAWHRQPMTAWAIGVVLIAVAPRFLVGSSEFLKEYQFVLASVGLSVWLGSAVAASLEMAPAWRERIV